MIDFSIHLITYNNEKHIEATLESIIKQKVNFSFEIVIGDDCSTDNTLDIIKQFQTKNSKVFNIVKNEYQLGILKNFKQTLDRCKGNYVFALAGDDLLKKEGSLQKMFDILSKDKTLGFIDCGFDKYYDNHKKTIELANENDIKSSKKDYSNKILQGKISPIGFCFNRKLLLKYVDFKTYIDMDITIEDYPILVDLENHTDFRRVNESLVIYRVHDDSYSHKKTFENHFFLNNQMRTLFDYFSNKYNYSEGIIQEFHINSYKELLFLAGYFEKKELGKEIFKKLKSKNIKDYIHFYASQNIFFRKLISFFNRII